jgi:hypothetical protein
MKNKAPVDAMEKGLIIREVLVKACEITGGS